MPAPKTFTYLQQSAPELNGRVGKTLGVLDYALADGGPSVTCSTIVVASTVATVTTATAHGFALGDWVTVSGATGITELNATVQVRSVTSDVIFTYTTNGANGSATGSPVVKRSALGWAKAFTGTNLRAYRAASGNRFYLRVDDTGTADSLVRGYNAMSAISTGTGPFPTVLQSTNGRIWKKNDQDDGVSITATSVVVLGGVATVTTPTAHGLQTRDWVTVAGATPSGLNGNVRVTAILSSTKYTYSTAAADGTATGTITTIKYVQKKWYLVGDATWFRFYVERANGVYDLYTFGDTAPELDSTVSTILSGIADGGMVVDGDPALVNHVIETYDSEKASRLFTSASNASAYNAKTTTRTLPALREDDKLSDVFLKVAGRINGQLPKLAAPIVNANQAYNSWTAVSHKPEGNPSATLMAMAVIMGPAPYVGNVFEEIN